MLSAATVIAVNQADGKSASFLLLSFCYQTRGFSRTATGEGNSHEPNISEN
jgi:hypothetical protein